MKTILTKDIRKILKDPITRTQLTEFACHAGTEDIITLNGKTYAIAIPDMSLEEIMKNQCDGCLAGIPLEGKYHIYPKDQKPLKIDHEVFLCEKYKYIENS